MPEAEPAVPTSDDLVQALAGLVSAPLRVAVDGPDAAGKSTLAAALGRRLGVEVTSVDDFHHPPEVRHRRGPWSPEGYYRDTFDYPALRRAVSARAGSVVLVEGVFLLRPELRDDWDLAVYLHVSPEETLRRALVRDVGLFGDAVRERYERRYLPGQALYRAEADPLARADVLVDHTDPARPLVLRWP
ncbi:hypothetical protein ACQPZF_07485 [Actinosynnema sp. CS-041913]|uniref:hypothetical protein n=1 Tax=Actinosynnema sp. CS-041913 TaxID=3239917 RepID=UPI003D8F029F